MLRKRWNFRLRLAGQGSYHLPPQSTLRVLKTYSRSPENTAKRRKQDNIGDNDEIVKIESPLIVAANGHKIATVNGDKCQGDALFRLRSTVAKARQSVEHLRSMRLEAGRRYVFEYALPGVLLANFFHRSVSLEDDMTPYWHSTRESNGSSPARQSPGPAWDNGMPVTFFDPKRDVNFNLVPRDEMNVISGRPANDLYPQFSPAATHFSSVKSTSYHNYLVGSTPSLNGLNTSALKSFPDIPSFPVQGPKKFSAWNKLKDSVQRAEKAVEEARLERQARSRGGG